MTDYASAFDEGQDAAQKVAKSKQEIDTVFQVFDKEIRGKTEGKLSIRREVREKSISIQEIFTFPEKKGEKYWVVAATNPAASKTLSMQIARWEPDKRGYPCRIFWQYEDHSCADKEALENTLADLLRDPLVGQKLYVLMQSEPKSPSGGSTEGGDSDVPD